jgi:hypothetical protein
MYGKHIILLAVSVFTASLAIAKLPAPSDEAKAKATEAAAKTAWTAKVDGYKLCLYQDKAAAHYYSDAKKLNKETKAPVATAACADPGVFVYPPVAAASAPAAPAANVAAAPAKK